MRVLFFPRMTVKTRKKCEVWLVGRVLEEGFSGKQLPTKSDGLKRLFYHVMVVKVEKQDLSGTCRSVTNEVIAVWEKT